MSPADRADERTLVAAAQNGDVSAFEMLLRSHVDAVYAHGLRFFGDPEAAQDVVQEVFLKVYRSIGTYDGNAAFSTWLFRVARNVCLDMFRQNRRRPVPVDPVELAAGSTPDHASSVLDGVMLEKAIRVLQPEDRDALNAVSLFGMSYQEAAEVLEVPVGTVKSRVFRARRTLVAAMGAPGGDSQ
ncbi:MAG: RNA polymerase sigma factor [Coriobacteriia bacterium]|nr:RNA polymerase sigma factor [Coriobacteriia bacterium]